MVRRCGVGTGKKHLSTFDGKVTRARLVSRDFPGGKDGDMLRYLLYELRFANLIQCSPFLCMIHREVCWAPKREGRLDG